MPGRNPRVRLSDMKAGQYFKDRTTWYQVVAVPAEQPDSDYRIHFTVRDRTGHVHGHFLYGVFVEVSPDNRRPVTWQPGALLREAHRLELKAEQLLKTVDSLRAHAKRAREEAREGA